jgi:hypothetical protein
MRARSQRDPAHGQSEVNPPTFGKGIKQGFPALPFRITRSFEGTSLDLDRLASILRRILQENVP